MLDGAKRIIELFDDDEFKPIIIQGDHGYGKSTYANRIVAEVGSVINGGKANWRVDHFKRHLGFHPIKVLNLWIDKAKRDYCFHWDDAGLWLHNLDFQDPFVKAVGKYMQVVRTDWACVIFTAISAEDISSKIRGLRNAILVDITKDGKDGKHVTRRTANAYILRKTWKGKQWKDYQWSEMFDSHVPDGFYDWYKPIRDHYSKMAKALMKKKAQEHPDLKELPAET